MTNAKANTRDPKILKKWSRLEIVISFRRKISGPLQIKLGNVDHHNLLEANSCKTQNCFRTSNSIAICRAIPPIRDRFF